MNLSINKISKQELSSMMQNTAMKEGWLYSHYDEDFYFDDPCNQIYAITVDGELAGCVLLHESASYVQQRAIRSVGIFLIIEKYRGQQNIIPYMLNNAIYPRINQEMIICFHSVPRAVNFYERRGYIKTPFADLFCSLKIEACNRNIVQSAKKLFEIGTLKKIEANEHDEIDDYTNQLFSNTSGIGFREFIQRWKKRPDATIISYFDKEVIKGFGIATVCKKINTERNEELYFRISPLYAETDAIAEDLLKGLVCFVLESGGVRIDLNTLASSETKFGTILKEIGFVVLGPNYLLCNHPEMIAEKPEILKKVFCSVPLEYPHEILAGLK